ncbi:MAG: hypothetical protein H0X38_05230 [Planctomycetes bacterium]|nr:hypothetical protein [Planctomycetota bacterium]
MTIAIRILILSAAVLLTSACGQGDRAITLDQTPEPVRTAILNEAAGDPIERITQGIFAGKECYTVAVARADRRSWYCVDNQGRTCE